MDRLIISHSQAVHPVPGPDETLASWQLFIVRKLSFSTSNNVLIAIITAMLSTGLHACNTLIYQNYYHCSYSASFFNQIHYWVNLVPPFKMYFVCFNFKGSALIFRNTLRDFSFYLKIITTTNPSINQQCGICKPP